MASGKRLFVNAFHITRNGIKTLVSIHETVRHNEVDQILGRETEPLCRALTTGGNLIRHLEAFITLAENKVICAWLSRSSDFYIQEKIIRAVSLMNLLYPGLATFNGHIISRYIRSLYQKLERSLHSNPPGKGFNPVNLIEIGIDNR